MQLHIARGEQLDLVVGGRHRGAGAAHHAGDLDVLAQQADLPVALDPAGLTGQAHQTLLRLDADLGEVDAAGTHQAVDHDVVDTGDLDLAVAARAGELAGAGGGDAGLARRHHGAGGEHDVVVRLEVALHGQGAGRVDLHVVAGAAGDHVALDDAVVARVQHDRGVDRLQQSGDVEVEVDPAGGDAAVKVEPAVAQDHAGDVEPAVGTGGRAHVDDGARCRGVDGIEAARHERALADVEAEQVGVDRALLHRQGVGAGQHQSAVAQLDVDLRVVRVEGEGGAHRVIGVVRLRHQELGRRQGVAQILHQVVDAGVVDRVDAVDVDGAAHLEVHQVEEQVQCDVGGQPAIGGGDPALRLDLVGVLRRQDVEGPRRVQVDGAVGARRDQADGAIQDDAPARIVGAAVGGVGLHRILAADEVDALAGADGLADADLVVRLHAHGGVAVEVDDLAAEGLTRGIELPVDLAAGDQHALDVGVLDRLDVDGPGRVVDDQLAGGVHLDADALGILATHHLDPGLGIGRDPRLDRVALPVDGLAAHEGLARRLQVQQAALLGPGEALADALPGRVELLAHRSAGDQAAQDLEVRARRDADQGAAVVRGQACRRQAAGGIHHHAQAVVVGAGLAGDQHHRLGGDDGRIHVDLLARGDRHRRVVAGPDDALRADRPARYDDAEEVHVSAAGDLDVAARLRGVQHRCLVDVDAAAPGVCPAQVGAVGAHAAVDRDVLRDVQTAFVVDPGIGLQGQAGVGARQDDVAADDEVVRRAQRQVGVVHQAGDGAGDQQAEGAVPEQVVGALRRQLFGDAVVVGVDEPDDVEVALAVLHGPAATGLDGGDGRRPRRQLHVVVVEGLAYRRRQHARVQGGDVDLVGSHAEQALARDRVEVLGMPEAGSAAADVDVAARRDRAGDPDLAARVENDVGVAAGEAGHRRAAGVDELRPGGDGAAGVDVEVVGGVDVDTRVCRARHDLGALEQGEVRAGEDVDPRAQPLGLHRRADLDRGRGDDLDAAVGVLRFDDAADVGGEAVGAVAVADDDIVAGGARHVDAHQLLAAQPAAHDHLLAGLEHHLPGCHTRIGRAQRIVDVLRVDVRQARVELDPVAGTADVAADVDAVGLEDRAIAQGGVNEPRFARGLDQGGVLHVADDHLVGWQAPREGGVADRDRREAVVQSGQIAHGDVHAGVRPEAASVEPGRSFARTAHAVVSVAALPDQSEVSSAADPVLARCEVHVVGYEADVGRGGDLARLQGQQRIRRRQLHVDAAGDARDPAGGEPGAHHVQVVRLAHGDVCQPADAAVHGSQLTGHRADRVGEADAIQDEAARLEVDAEEVDRAGLAHGADFPGRCDIALQRHALQAVELYTAGVDGSIHGDPVGFHLEAHRAELHGGQCARQRRLGSGVVDVHNVYRVGEHQFVARDRQVVVVDRQNLARGIHVDDDHVVAARVGDREGAHAARQGAPVDAHHIFAVAAVDGAATAADQHRVVAGLAVERVAARVSDERVVAVATLQGVVAGAAVQHVVAGPALQHVVAGAAVEHAVTAAGFDIVVVQAAVEHVRARADDQQVVVALAAADLHVRLHVGGDVDEVVTGERVVDHDRADAGVGAGHAQGLHLHGLVARRAAHVGDRVALGDDILVEVAQVHRIGAHVQAQDIADLRRDHRRRAPAPSDAAGEGQAESADPE